MKHLHMIELSSFQVNSGNIAESTGSLTSRSPSISQLALETNGPLNLEVTLSRLMPQPSNSHSPYYTVHVIYKIPIMLCTSVMYQCNAIGNVYQSYYKSKSTRSVGMNQKP